MVTIGICYGLAIAAKSFQKILMKIREWHLPIHPLQPWLGSTSYPLMSRCHLQTKFGVFKITLKLHIPVGFTFLEDQYVALPTRLAKEEHRKFYSIWVSITWQGLLISHWRGCVDGAETRRGWEWDALVWHRRCLNIIKPRAISLKTQTYKITKKQKPRYGKLDGPRILCGVQEQTFTICWFQERCRANLKVSIFRKVRLGTDINELSSKLLAAIVYVSSLYLWRSNHVRYFDVDGLSWYWEAKDREPGVS